MRDSVESFFPSWNFLWFLKQCCRRRFGNPFFFKLSLEVDEDLFSKLQLSLSLLYFFRLVIPAASNLKSFLKSYHQLPRAIIHLPEEKGRWYFEASLCLLLKLFFLGPPPLLGPPERHQGNDQLWTCERLPERWEKEGDLQVQVGKQEPCQPNKKSPKKLRIFSFSLLPFPFSSISTFFSVFNFVMRSILSIFFTSALLVLSVNAKLKIARDYGKAFPTQDQIVKRDIMEMNSNLYEMFPRCIPGEYSKPFRFYESLIPLKGQKILLATF